MILITCSGISNTGKVTTLAAQTLLMRYPGAFEWIQASRHTLEGHDGHRILVLDGCGDCCGMKKLAAAGRCADLHLISTSFGIVKNGMAEVTFKEIETICQAVRDSGELSGEGGKN